MTLPRHLQPFTPAILLALLGTSCLPKSTTLQLVPASGTDVTSGPLALIERLVHRHRLTAAEPVRDCGRAWTRTVTRQAPLGPRSAKLTVCADYARLDTIAVSIIESIPANRGWSAAADSLRRELADSLATLGTLAVTDR